MVVVWVISVPRVVGGHVGLWLQYGLFQYPEWLVVGGAVVVVWVISVPRVVGGHSSGFPWLLKVFECLWKIICLFQGLDSVNNE